MFSKSSEMATGSKTQENKINLQLPAELPYDFVKKITNDFSKKREISESPFGKLYKVRFSLIFICPQFQLKLIKIYLHIVYLWN